MSLFKCVKTAFTTLGNFLKKWATFPTFLSPGEVSYEEKCNLILWKISFLSPLEQIEYAENRFSA